MNRVHPFPRVVKTHQGESTDSRSRTRSLRRILVVVPLALSIVTAAWFAIGSADRNDPGYSTETTARRHAVAAVERARQQVEAANRGAVDRCEARIAATMAPHLEEAKRIAPSVGRSLGSYGNSCRLAFLLARDRVMGTEKTEEFLQEELSPVLDHLAAAVAAAEAEVADLEAEIAMNQNRFATEILREMDRLQSVGAEESLGKSWAETSGKVRSNVAEITARRLSGAVGLGFEALCLKQTIVMVRNTCAVGRQVLGKTVARLAGTASASGGAVAIDGPIPVGDIVGAVVAIGGGAWCAWDLRKAHTTLQVRLQDDLRQGIDEAGRNLEGDLGRSLNESLEAMAQGNRIAVEELVRDLEEMESEQTKIL